MPPRVSVVMPICGEAPFLIEALASVQAQTEEAWELLVVDDGMSTDARALVASTAQLDARVRVLDCEGRGVSAARNTALDVSQAPYVAYLDSDNTWTPTFLATTTTALTADPTRMWCCTGQRIAHIRGHAVNRSLPPVFDGAQLRRENYIDLNTLVHTRCDLRFDTALTRLVDWDLILQLHDRSEPIYMPHVDGGLYRLWGPSQISRREPYDVNRRRIAEKRTDVTR